MATKRASDFRLDHSLSLERVSLPDEDNLIEGGDIVFNLDAAVTAARALVLRKYDRGRYGEFKPGQNQKPHMIVKCSVDCSVNNVTVEYPDSTTLYTFDTDCSTIPKYVVFRVNDDGDWELA